ncbi:YfjL-like protein [Kurthia sibirica]|uniref:YfjL-like N-terminal domain-containing protein n=1 Tax=Kurthia sibirica TaxID=202750 RepID=A0A2U3AK23_9BACL|nr:hypothetical protein [Kurthia sibirica]PWI24844.1 hypothetical protein DEX24_11315 [Kurthia sibirica]GEK33308.1 hypothetical protein KSI01_08410 [Kurthia sibirica]
MTKTTRRVWMIIGIVVICLLITNNFTSNPYAKHRAALKVKTFLNENYKKYSFDVADGHFNRQQKLYQFTVTNKNDAAQSYKFKIENGDDYSIVENTINIKKD